MKRLNLFLMGLCLLISLILFIEAIEYIVRLLETIRFFSDTSRDLTLTFSLLAMQIIKAIIFGFISVILAISICLECRKSPEEKEILLQIRTEKKSQSIQNELNKLKDGE